MVYVRVEISLIRVVTIRNKSLSYHAQTPLVFQATPINKIIIRQILRFKTTQILYFQFIQNIIISFEKIVKHHTKMLNRSYFTPSLDKLTTFTSLEHIPLQKQSQNYNTLEKRIKTVKYPALPFQPVISIDQYIQSGKSQIQERNLKKVLKTQNKLNFIRKVRGDGNCFIRAVAFQFLSQVNSPRLQKCFPYLDSIKLAISEQQYIPKSFIQFYDSKFLSYCLQQNWEVQYERSLKRHNNSHRLALAALFAENPYLDFITVLYMRAVSVLALRKFRQDSEIKEFLEDNDEEKLRNYGSLSDGLTHFLFNKMLSIDLTIYQVRNSQIIQYNYPTKREKSIRGSLLYHHNHYDLLQKEADIDTECVTHALNRKESYYGSVEKDLVEGECINCQQFRLIDVDNCLCEDCSRQYEKAHREFNKRVNSKKGGQNNDMRSEESVDLSAEQKPKKRIKIDSNDEKKRGKPKRRRLFGCFGIGN